MKGVKIAKAKNGQGIFSTRRFLAGELIFEIKGTLITCYEDDDVDEQTRLNAIRFDKTRYLSPRGEMGDFLNHSCEPNAKVVKKQGKLFFIAIRDIEKGEEILFDYSTITASDDIWEMKCNCGSKNCRKLIGQFRKLPKGLRTTYLSLGRVPKYILD